jgi:hypothetical protein
MKFLLLVTLFSANIFASDCSQFPSKSGPFSRDVYVKGLLVKVKANFKISKGVEWGNAYTSHTFESPEFFVDGKKVSLNTVSAKEIIRALGYDHLSYQVYHKVRMLDFYHLLDSDLRVRSARSGEYILNDGSPIMGYHPVCANWQY